jgi:hypothetical protein
MRLSRKVDHRTNFILFKKGGNALRLREVNSTSSISQSDTIFARETASAYEPRVARDQSGTWTIFLTSTPAWCYVRGCSAARTSTISIVM